MYQSEELIKELVEFHGNSRASLLPILQGVVLEHNYLTDRAMIEVAKELDISAAEVYGTASFYSFLDTEPRGKYVIRICKTITCSMKGKNEVVEILEDMLKIKVGQTTSNGKFTLLETNCMGWCHKAPAMLVNDTPYTGLTRQKLVNIIHEYLHQ